MMAVWCNILDVYAPRHNADFNIIDILWQLTTILSGYHADTPITIKAEPSIWPTATFINIHEHPI